MEVISMNGEVAQICDIAIYARYALKTKNKIAYTPSKYENKIEFLFTDKTFHANCCKRSKFTCF